jgi:uncharacterized protein YeaO (DUF488 family)
MIRPVRIYDLGNQDQTFTILVDRLWPRGISKDRVKVDLWMKEVAPSSKLRKWFGHDPAKWDAFKLKYRQEIMQGDKVQLLSQIKRLEKEKGSISLLYSAKDKEHNNAVVLAEMLEEFG